MEEKKEKIIDFILNKAIIINEKDKRNDKNDLNKLSLL